MLEMYTAIQRGWGNNQRVHEIKVNNQKQEEGWKIHKYWNNIREEGDGVLKKPD